ncbi:unnamed protein product [Rotaria sordida]|uniref:Uncharacterized protein n=1 Tax=Rotaria sordida TaxID=392033 RepID=A0A818PN45_9BILA|nr:unnamed protein product [Rotaria sordida]CAF3628154.1 unnamed protein product [Rotaria sordida]
MIRSIQRLHKLREITKILNEQRGKIEKHLSIFNIVHSTDNCRLQLFAAYHDYREKFQIIEFSQELATIRAHITVAFLRLS